MKIKEKEVVSVRGNVGNVRFIQRMNRAKVLEHIRKNSPVSRNELAKVSGLSLSSITNIVGYLLDENLVSETDYIKVKGAGRNAVRIEFNTAAMSIVAVNIEADEATVSVTDLAGSVLESRSISFEEENEPEKILLKISDEICKLSKSRKDVKAIGFTVSGHITKDGRVSSSILNWRNVDAKAIIEIKTGLSVYVANNTKTKALWTIHALNDEHYKNVVFLDMANDGIGIAHAYNGEINELVAGELGHTVVAGTANGYLEKVCSIRYIEESYERISGKKLSFSEIRRAAAGDDEIAKKVTDEAASYLSAAIINIIMIFEPDMIIINGSELLKIEEFYENAINNAVLQISSLDMKKPFFRKVNLAPEQAVQGAAQFAADNLFGIDGPDDIL